MTTRTQQSDESPPVVAKLFSSSQVWEKRLSLSPLYLSLRFRKPWFSLPPRLWKWMYGVQKQDGGNIWELPPSYLLRALQENELKFSEKLTVVKTASWFYLTTTLFGLLKRWERSTQDSGRSSSMN